MTKECRVCSNEISSTAKPCPNCGEKEPFKSNRFFIIIGLSVISFGIVLMFYFRGV